MTTGCARRLVRQPGDRLAADESLLEDLAALYRDRLLHRGRAPDPAVRCARRPKLESAAWHGAVRHAVHWHRGRVRQRADRRAPRPASGPASPLRYWFGETRAPGVLEPCRLLPAVPLPPDRREARRRLVRATRRCRSRRMRRAALFFLLLRCAALAVRARSRSASTTTAKTTRGASWSASAAPSWSGISSAISRKSRPVRRARGALLGSAHSRAATAPSTWGPTSTARCPRLSWRTPPRYRKPFLWMNYNIWKLRRKLGRAKFEEKWGFVYRGVDGATPALPARFHTSTASQPTRAPLSARSRNSTPRAACSPTASRARHATARQGARRGNASAARAKTPYRAAQGGFLLHRRQPGLGHRRA